jgi:hypothetical protein
MSASEWLFILAVAFVGGVSAFLVVILSTWRP